MDGLPFASAGHEIAEIPVHISYEIIHLFSEGLYKSPHKAIEELVTNGYDANARRVHVLLPESDEESVTETTSLWVIDDGHGMDVSGFRQLWSIANSDKTDVEERFGRPIIGQFGIGKLASYVLAWNLTHVSYAKERYLVTSMNFRDVSGTSLSDKEPVKISLREVEETEARNLLKEIKIRDPDAWRFMFGEDERATSWTAAALSEFKDLYGRLRTGTLKWVLSSGLPLHTDFQIWINGDRLSSSKENLAPLQSFPIDVELNGIGRVAGQATIYKDRLTGGKSNQIGRSNGFFVKVRKRVINLEDELFGLEAQSHGAWSRFAMEVDADGLRPYLLSSREGVRECDETRCFSEELRKAFNKCRNVYDATRDSQSQLDVTHLLDNSTPSTYVRDPLLTSVRNVAESGAGSFYIGAPREVADEDTATWMESFEQGVKEKPIQQILFDKNGENAPVLRYDPDSRKLLVNSEHPFIDKLNASRNRKEASELFASSEALLEGQLAEHGIRRGVVSSLLDDRDRVLRLVAGYASPTAQEVIRRLENATVNETALERATGSLFHMLGFKYDVKGGNLPGPDGLLHARLGLHPEGLADYKLVYDAKQTGAPAVPASKVDLSSLEEFRTSAGADFGFFIAGAYQAEEEENGKLNKEINHASGAYERLTLLKVKHLKELAELHHRYGITLTDLRSLFKECKTVSEVDGWIVNYRNHLKAKGEIPLQVLLTGLEEEKSDPLARPNIAVVRSKYIELSPFEPGRLKARLRAIESVIGSSWLHVDDDSFEVTMHQSDSEILKELDRNIYRIYG